jgi:hypothetical protein
LVVLVFESSISGMLNRCSTTELHSQPNNYPYYLHFTAG